MNATLFLCVMVATAAAPSNNIDSILEKNKMLLGHHRGYVKAVSADPIRANAEEGYLRLLSNPVFAILSANFEEALGADTAASEAFDAYCLELGKEPELRIQRDERLRGLVKDQDGASSWWAELNNQDSGAVFAYRELLDHLKHRPTQLRTWFNRQVSLACEPSLADWVRYWHRLVRRTEGLGEYWRYAAHELTTSEFLKSSERRWLSVAGPMRPWPPEGSPPSLDLPPAAHESAKKGAVSKKTAMPAKPSKTAPRMPVHPSLPERPTAPTPEHPGSVTVK